MPHADPEPGKPELLPDLLDRLAAQKLAADFRAIDTETRRYHRKLAGLEPWSTFELPPSLRQGGEVVHGGEVIHRCGAAKNGPFATPKTAFSLQIGTSNPRVARFDGDDGATNTHEAVASSLDCRPGVGRGRGEPGR